MSRRRELRRMIREALLLDPDPPSPLPLTIYTPPVSTPEEEDEFFKNAYTPIIVYMHKTTRKLYHQFVNEKIYVPEEPANLLDEWSCSSSAVLTCYSRFYDVIAIADAAYVDPRLTSFLTRFVPFR